MSPRIRISVATICVALILAACAAPVTPPTQTLAPSPTATARPSPTAPRRPAPIASPRPTLAPAPSPTAAARPLVVWAVGPEAQRPALTRLIADVAHASGVRATVVGKSPDALAADMRAGPLAGLAPPDVIWGSEDDLFLLMREGAIQPAGDGLDDGDFLPPAVAAATIKGERWGTPLAARGALFLLYNRKLVSSPPATTDALIAEARALNRGGTYGIVAGWAEGRWLAAWLAGFGQGLPGAAPEPALDTPQMVAALAFLKELRTAGPPPPSTYAEGARLFRQGRAAFAIDGDWSLAGYQGYTDTLDLAIAPLPAVSGAGSPGLGPLGGVYLLYGATLSGPQFEQARALGRALAAPIAQALIARDLGMLPALREALSAPEVRANPALAVAAGRAAASPPIAPTVAQRCAWQAAETVLPPMLLGDLTPEQAARRMQELALACAS